MRHYFSLPNCVLYFILILAFILRVWNIAGVPPSPSMDEASISYNAYSLLKTGGDEYGQIPTLSHRSYDDWRRATYLYLVLPFVAVFDLNVFSVRFPSVILSVLTVLSTYFIALYIFFKKSSFSIIVALLSSFLLAISPWHIYISRLGHESNVYMSFFVFGILFFLMGERKKKWSFLLISLLLFTISMVGYYAGQAIVPVFLLGTTIIYRKNLFSMIKSNKKMLFVFALIFVGLLLLLKEFFSPYSLVRFNATSTFTREAHGDLFDKRVLMRNKAVDERNYLGMIWYNQRLYSVEVFVYGYFAHFNPQWLFINPDSQYHKVPNLGLLYIWQIPFLLIGFLSFILSKLVDGKTRAFILLWLLLSPLPGAIATQAPHAMRAYTAVSVLQIITAFGLSYLFFKLKSHRLLLGFGFFLIAIWSIWSFIFNYFIVFSKEQSKSFEYALSNTIPYVMTNQDKYKKIVFSNQDNLYQSYMLFLFHSKYDPSLYQQQGGTGSGGYAQSHKFGKFEFRDIDILNEKLKKDNLYVVNYSDSIKNKRIEKVFKNLDGKTGIALISP